MSPWSPGQAMSHTKKANTPHKKRQWMHAANAALKQYGDDETAIKVANAAVGGVHKKGK